MRSAVVGQDDVERAGGDAADVNGVEAHPGRQLGRHVAGQPVERRLDRAVGGEAGLGHAGRARRDVDDRALPGGVDHAAGRQLGQRERRRHVEVEGRSRTARSCPWRRLGMAPPALFTAMSSRPNRDTCSVDQLLELAAGRVTSVGTTSARRPVCLDQRGDLLEVAGSRGGQRRRRRPPGPGRRRCRVRCRGRHR